MAYGFLGRPSKRVAMYPNAHNFLLVGGKSCIGSANPLRMARKAL